MSSPSSDPSTGASFTPRKEFMKESSNQPNTFALLALSGPNCIRLYSFVHIAVTSIRRLLEQSSLIISSREESVQNLYEFALDGKPWANPKSVPTETLLVNIIAVIYRCGYTYLSLIDYGREADDRLVMTFSKPGLISCPPTPPPSSSSPAKIDSPTGSPREKHPTKRIPFALSFSSMTVMRVISPPLHLTPAILQAVRASWPRGVVAEKKVGDNCYEFRLKGYKWFQQDTFATDSLRHILSLLSSLDAHSFTLLTSISLTSRSKVKDLWIFTGPAPEDGLFVSSEHFLETMSAAIPSSTEQKRPGLENQLLHHRRLATEPPPVIPSSPVGHQPRASTESPTRPRLATQGQVLRKPAPRAQIPISVVQDSENADEFRTIQSPRAHMPNTISAGTANMTGVGASPNVSYATSPFDTTVLQSHEPTPNSPILSNDGPMESSQAIPHPGPDSSKTPPLPDPLASHQVMSSPHTADPLTDSPASTSINQPLLGLGTFRDSEVSSNNDTAYEIPVKWTGQLREEFGEGKERPKLQAGHLSSGPQLPGAWQPTPIAERSEDEVGTQSAEAKKDSTTPIHELDSRFESPQIVRPDVPLRKSEAALVGVIQSTSTSNPSHEKLDSKGFSAKGQGWVLVSVDNTTPGPSDVPHDNGPFESKKDQVSSPPFAEVTPSPTTAQESRIEQASPTAKAIVIIDAVDSKQQKSRSSLVPRLPGESIPGVRRFFSLSRKTSKKVAKDGESTDNDRLETDKIGVNSISRSNFRDRLRLIGTPEAPRRQGKRRSID